MEATMSWTGVQLSKPTSKKIHEGHKKIKKRNETCNQVVFACFLGRAAFSLNRSENCAKYHLPRPRCRSRRRKPTCHVHEDVANVPLRAGFPRTRLILSGLLALDAARQLVLVKSLDRRRSERQRSEWIWVVPKPPEKKNPRLYLPGAPRNP